MDNDFNLSSVPLLSVDDQILMPIATMGASHLHHQVQQQQQQQQQPAELVNNTSHNSDETATILTTHLGCVSGSGGGGVGETTSNSFGNFFTENHTMNTMHADIVHHPAEILPVVSTRPPQDENDKGKTIPDNTTKDIAADEDEDNTEELVAEVQEEDYEEVDDEEDVEDLIELDANIVAEEITPDMGNTEVEIKNETPDEVLAGNEDINSVSDRPIIESSNDATKDQMETEPGSGQPTNNDNDNDEASQTKDSQSESEQPMSSKRASQRKEEEVDENQCRVCCTKEDLVSIFKKIDGKTGAEMLMILCPTVSIAVKDFLPQFVCHICMGKIMLAIKLKQQVETTEKELRKKLSRHKNKVRRPPGYVVISALLDSDTATDEEANNDEEFKVSDVASATPSEGSDSSEFSDNKKKRTRSRKRRKSAVTTPTLKTKSKSGKSENGSSENEDDGDPIGNHKRKRSSNSSPETFACDVCEQIFTRKQSLILHRKVHDTDREPIACRVCGKKFKVKGAYRSHMEKHREEKVSRVYECQKCSRKFGSSAELKDHMDEDRKPNLCTIECLKCKRSFVSSARLKKHQQQHCPAIDPGNRRKPEVETYVVGRDLFKSVAPLTTTYWSDSFSD